MAIELVHIHLMERSRSPPASTTALRDNVWSSERLDQPWVTVQQSQSSLVEDVYAILSLTLVKY
ncbi:hypothetical protein JB92DRAFT_2890066 [Gautieria morchelliformis]|nr:hypothetical protein JB92DRAFT_2890066 [Gautieria morchelliformis]